MAKRNALKDVNPEAITICKKGANRQLIFLRKSAEEQADLLTLPHEAGRMLKAADEGGGWSTFYCVVAEPGASEDPGMTGEAGSTDVWLDADEIRKAAHRLQKNKAYVNLVHDGLAEDGLSIVETAVALADLQIEGPDGETHTIKKDSWYVAIECNEDAIAKVEAGEITGVSLEGTGVRVPLEELAKSRTPEQTAAALRKSLSFSDIVGEKEMQDKLWRAWSTLETVIFEAFRDDDIENPKAAVRTALAEFDAYLLGALEHLPDEAHEGLAKILGTFESSTDEEEIDMGLTEDIAALKKTVEENTSSVNERLEKAEDVSSKLVDLAGKLTERIEALASGAAPEGGTEPVKKTDSVEDLVQAIGKVADRMDEQDSELESIAKSVRALSAGSSSQEEETETRVRKSDNPLAGLLA